MAFDLSFYQTNNKATIYQMAPPEGQSSFLRTLKPLFIWFQIIGIDLSFIKHRSNGRRWIAKIYTVLALYRRVQQCNCHVRPS